MSAVWPARSRILRRPVFTGAVFLVALLWNLPGAVPAGDRHFLWEVKSDTSTAYLLGSIHVATNRLYPLAEPIEAAFRRSDALVVEVDLNKVSPDRSQIVMMQRGVYDDGRTLETELSDDVYARVAGRFAKAGMPVDLFAGFKPWLAALTLTSLEVQRLGFDPKYGIDRHFLDLAEGQKPVLELESFEEQISLLDRLSDRDQELFLLYTMEDLDSLSGQLNDLLRAWAAGDEKRVKGILDGSVRDRPELTGMVRSFINDRNEKMLGKIVGYLEGNEGTFIVVGAGHLVGDEGLIELLRNRGYAVRQM